jgi:hypothetical protein
MIKLAVNTELKIILNLCKNSAIGCRIESLIRAYGINYGFLLPYILTDNNNPYGVLCSVDNNFLLVSKRKLTDGEETELTSFIKIVGGKTLLSDEPVKALKNINALKGTIILNENLKHKITKENSEAEINFDTPFKKVYSILTSRKELTLPEFNSWYVDISHQVRHETMLVSTVLFNKIPAAAAVASAITDKAVFLSGVTSLPQFSGRGLGMLAVKSLLSNEKIKNKKVFAFRRAETEKFYSKLKFNKTGEFYQYRF